MKKRLLTNLIGLLVTISAFAYSGGNGTELNPYKISSKADMEQLATTVNGGQTYVDTYFLLTRDLTGATDTVTTVIGNSNSYYFSGIFDGGGYEIAVKISITVSGSSNQNAYAGIFGRISGATIKNLGVSGSVSSSSSSSFSSDRYSGGICGYSGKIMNCFSANAQITNVSDPTRARIGRIGGADGTYQDCYALDDMLVNGDPISSQSTTSKDGKDATMSSFQSQSWIEGNLSWDFDNVWRITEGQEYPTFKRVIIALEVPEVVYGDRISLNAGSNNTATPVLYESSDNSIAEMSGNLLIAKKAGTVTITASQAASNGYFAGETKISFEIKKRALTVTANAFSMIYGDTPPNYTCRYEDFISGDTENILTKSPVFTCSATSSSPAGKYPITPSGAEAENYTFLYTADTLTIQKRNLQVTPNNATRVYSYANPAFTVKYDDFVNNDNASTAIASAPVASTLAGTSSVVGEYEITCSGGNAANYSFTYNTGTLQVTKAPLTNVGSYSITPSGAEAQNYSFTYQQGFLTIGKRNLQVIPDNKSRMYGDANPAFTLSYSGFVNNQTASALSTRPVASTSATIYNNVGEYTITCSGGSATNYSFTYGTGKLEVTKAPLTITANSTSRAYGSNNPTFNVSYSGFRNSDDKNVLSSQPQISCAATQTSDAWTYPITVLGADALNYDISHLPGTLTVSKKPATLIAEAASMTYGDVVPSFTYRCDGFVNDDDNSALSTLPLFTCDATSQSNAGNYPITPSGAEAQNYTFTYQSGTLNIQKRNLSVTPNDASRVYGYANPTFTLSYSGFVNGNSESNILSKPSVNTVANIYSDAGAYDITCSGGNATNYSFTYNTGTLEVTKAPLTVTADDKTRHEGEPNPEFTVSYSGFVNGDDVSDLDNQPRTICNATAASVPDTYPIYIEGGSDNNYEINYQNGTLTVLPGTGINHPESVAVSVYPNPAKNDLYIQSDFPIERVELYSGCPQGHCQEIKKGN